LPDDFQEISHIYQRPSGDVLIVVKNLYYFIDFPSFNVKSGYNSQSIENLGIPKGKRIDAIFRTYSGKTYIFYDKVLYVQLRPLQTQTPAFDTFCQIQKICNVYI
jgi:hypothetical protein